MKLLVDSGSTKADWIAIDDNGKVLFTTQSLGLNPEVLSKEETIIIDQFCSSNNAVVFCEIAEQSSQAR